MRLCRKWLSFWGVPLPGRTRLNEMVEHVIACAVLMLAGLFCFWTLPFEESYENEIH